MLHQSARVVIRPMTAMFIGLVVVGAPPATAQLRDRSGPLELLKSRQVREELQLTVAQIEELEEIRKRVKQQYGDWVAELSRLDVKRRRKRMNEIRKSLPDRLKKLKDEVNQVLTDDQRERLGQLALQKRLQRQGLADMLRDQAFRDQLGITDLQLVELQKVGKEAAEQYRVEVAQARERARNRILEVLTEDQRNQWYQLLGRRLVPQRDTDADVTITE